MTLARAFVLVCLPCVLVFAGLAQADPVRITAYPNDVPDDGEQVPRAKLFDAPDGWGPHSWQGPSSGKSNYHVRYLADGDVLSTLFPDDAETMTINDLAEISYFTKRPSETPAGRDWWVQIYTRPDGTDDASSWYGYRFINNYNDHTATGTWTSYSTNEGAMTFNRNDDNAGTAAGTELTLSGLKTTYWTELIEMISIQTNSAWDGFDGYVDGLTITLDDGATVGEVNLEAVPTPTGMVGLLSMGLAGLALCGRIRRRKK